MTGSASGRCLANAAALDRFGRPRLLIIVQAEVDAEGKTFFGVIGDGTGRIEQPENLTDIKPIKKKFSLFDLFK